MSPIASELVNWSAVWKICVAAFVGGVGVVVVFGILLFGVKLANSAKSSGARFASYTLSGVCGLICVGVFVVGIYAMAEKPSSKAKKAHSTKSAAAVAPSGSAARKLSVSVR